VRISLVLLGIIFFVAVGDAAERPADGTCAATCIDVFGGVLLIPQGYRLQTDFGDVLRLTRIDPDPTKPYGNIYIGKADSLPHKESREASAKELGATFERQSRGTVQIEVTTRITKQLLVDKPVRYVSVLLYDTEHYIRITDSNPDVWKQMIEHCAGCGRK
jgi:hypothetical protein